MERSTFNFISMRKFKTISTYDPTDPALCEIPKGASVTIPARALSIAEIYRRSVAGAVLPNISFANPLDSTPGDEGFEDAFDQDVDIIDKLEASQNVSYIYERLKEQKRAKPVHTESTTDENIIDSPESVTE